jgi:hypothetical protein
MGSATNRYKATFSCWVKKSATGTTDTQQILNSWNSTNYRFQIYFQGGTNADRLALYNVDNGSANMYFETNRLFRDVNAWYHIYIAVDTTLSTQGDRLKFYVNGERITSFAEDTYPAQNADMSLGASSYTLNIGRYGGGGYNFDGSMSHFYYVDGSVIDVGQFGSTDSTTGEWKINTNPTISSYGNEGFLILKDGDTITDQSPNSNNFQVGNGTLTKTEDNPSNVFATFSNLSGNDTMTRVGNGSVLSNGNTKVTCTGNVYNPFPTTIGINSGKYYAEFKLKNAAADAMIGIFAKYGASGNYLGSQAYQYCWYNDSGRIIGNNANIQTGVGQYTTNDIIGIALDCDNNKLYFHKNGTYITNGSGTGNPSSGTYGYSITDPDSTDLGFYFMSALDWGGTNRAIWEANFGNGYFGTTAVSSAGTNASGIGIFEYDVPTGFTALSTKGLNL